MHKIEEYGVSCYIRYMKNVLKEINVEPQTKKIENILI